jgi:hypothetical protein
MSTATTAIAARRGRPIRLISCEKFSTPVLNSKVDHADAIARGGRWAKITYLMVNNVLTPRRSLRIPAKNAGKNVERMNK